MTQELEALRRSHSEEQESVMKTVMEQQWVIEGLRGELARATERADRGKEEARRRESE